MHTFPTTNGDLTPPKKWWSGKWKVIIPVVAIVVLGGGLFISNRIIKKQSVSTPDQWDKLVVDQQYLPEYTLTPTKNSKYGIASQETFIFKTKEPQDETVLRDNLVASRKVTLTKTSDTEYKVTPAEKIGVGGTISFSLKNNSHFNWTFQTAPKIEITKSLPENKSVSAPINTGIEITFNNDNYELRKTDIEITPSVDFRIEHHDEVATIIPLNPLQPKTTYTVTIKKGWGLLASNNVLTENYVFSFQTTDKNNNRGRISLAEDFQEIFPDEHLVTKAYSSEFDKNAVITAEVYKFTSADQFLSSRTTLDKITASWMKYYGETNPVDVSQLSRVASADIKLQEKENLTYLEFPQNFDEGMYLVQFWYNNRQKVEQLWIQSSSVVGYVSVGKLQTAVWINSANGESVEAANVSVLGTGNVYSTNTDGWVSFATPSYLFEDVIKHYISVSTSAGKNLLLPIKNLSESTKPEATTAADYWSYIYHERILYKPSDTVYFWGVVKNRDTGTPPASVQIYLEDVLNQSVIPQADGSYFGKIELKDAPLGYDHLVAKVNDVEMSESYFQIADYVKPELKIVIEGNKKTIYSDESIEYKAKVSFFDGTPASNMTLYLSSEYDEGKVDKSEAVANKNGEITFKYQPKYDTSHTYPRYERVVVSAVKSGEAPSDGSASVYVYGSRLKLDAVSKQQKAQASVDATVNTLDLDRINLKGMDDPISGVAANQKVSISVTKIWYKKSQTGTYYDYIEKITKPKYTYTRHEDIIEKKDTFTDASGKVVYIQNLELNNSYVIDMTTADKQGKVSQKKNYFYYSDYQNDSDQSPKAYLIIDRDSNEYDIGDEVEFTIQKNGANYQKAANSKFLFVVANRGKQDVSVTNDPQFKFVFESKHIPGVYVGSIIFNGRYYEEVSINCKGNWSCGGYDYYYDNDYHFNPLVVRYQMKQSQLDLTIIADKNKYQPGDQANVRVKVAKQGSLISGATVQLTLVDEALAAIGGVKEPSPLTTLYKQVSSLIYYNYYSHKPVLPDGPEAEMGGGGGGRDLFKDTAFFGTAITDENGIATFSIKLPDNITNWLTYAQAISNNVDAGYVKSSIIATKDFFVTSQFPRTITTKDAASVAVSAFGNILNEKVQIPADIIVETGTQQYAKNNVKVRAFQESYADIPKLAEGTYTVTTKSSYQNSEDGITLPLTVINSRLDFDTTTRKIAQKGDQPITFGTINLNPAKPISLIITNEGKGKYYYDLARYCYQNSNRLEKQIASLKASQIITNRFTGDGCPVDKTNLAAFQGSDGGLRQVVWGSTDLETTLWAVYVNPTIFDKNKLITYFNDYLANSTEDKILKNWGLTLLGIPKVNELNQLVSKAVSFKERVLLALAQHSAGNTEKSKELYYAILGQYAYVNKPYIRIESDHGTSNYNKYALDTSYTLLLGTVNHITGYDEALNRYLDDYGGMVSSVVLDVANISYIDKLLNDLPDTNTVVTVKSNTQNVTRDISKQGSVRMGISQRDIASLAVNVVEGKAEVGLNYSLSFDGFSKLSPDNRLLLKKTTTKIKGEPGNSIKMGDILSIKLKYGFSDNAPLGCYVITDHIPSGMTYLENPNDFGFSAGHNGMLYLDQGNIVKGCVSNSKWWNLYSNNTSIYFVRVVGVGKFIQEPAIIQSSTDLSIFQKTAEEYITVDK